MEGSVEKVSRIGIGLAAACLAACSSGGGGSGEATGELSLAITDAPVDTVEEIWVQYTGVRVKPQSGPPIEFVFDEPEDIDMLVLTDGTSQTLLSDVRVPAGVYNWIELMVNAELDGTYDSYVVTTLGEHIELRVPSGSQSGLRLVRPFTITADQKVSLLIDWDMRMGLTNPVGQPGYFLKPAFRVIDKKEYGTLTGVVDYLLVSGDSCENDLVTDKGNAVYIYAPLAEAEMPDDIGGGTNPTPVATAAVKQDENGFYTYEVILSPGDFHVAFTCQAGADTELDEDIEIGPVKPALIERGETSVVDFP